MMEGLLIYPVPWVLPKSNFEDISRSLSQSGSRDFESLNPSAFTVNDPGCPTKEANSIRLMLTI